MGFSTSHIAYIGRSYLDVVHSIQLNGSCSYPQQGSLGLTYVKSLPFANQEKTSELKTHWIDLFSGVFGLGASIGYLIIGVPNSVSLFLATASHQGQVKRAAYGSPLKTLLTSSFPGGDFKELLQAGQSNSSSLPQLIRDLPYGALITGTPAGLSGQQTAVGLPIDRLIRALYGRCWAYGVVAQPMNLQAIQALNNAALAEFYDIANAERSANAASAIADKYRQLLNRFWQKLQIGQSQGLWQVASYILSADPIAHLEAKTIAKAIFSGPIAAPEPIRVLDIQGDAQTILGKWGVPNIAAPQSPGKIQHPSHCLSLLNSTELAAMIHLPTQEMPGYFIRPQVRFDVTPHQNKREKDVQIGEVIHHGQGTGVPYGLSPDSLTRHAMVVGTTGAGKTNSLFNLLRQLTHRHVPWLVIEPAKTEYRTLLGTLELQGRLQIFTLGDETISPFRLNPFEVKPGIAIQTHIDHLKAVFNASFVMYAPMPYVLERCIHEIYEDKGWDLITNKNARGIAWPTLTDLYNKIGAVVDSLGYDTKLNQDIKAALKTRINSLRIGGKGRMLDTHTSLPMTALLAQPTVLELQAVGDDDEKAFLIGLVLMTLYEHYRAQGHQTNDSLKHVTVVEEAHRLLKNTPTVYSMETANMTGQAVETFTQILAEIRAYGEGLIVAEQIPSKLSPDIVKNTNLKLVHRLVAAEDRQLIGGTMGLTQEQAQWLGTCNTGEAAVFSTGDDAPIRIQVPEAKVRSTPSGQELQAAMVTFQEQHALCYRRFPWFRLDDSFAQKHQREALRIVENREFQEVFARYVMSLAASDMAYLQELPSVQQTVFKLAKGVASSDLLSAVMLYAVDDFVDQRGQQYGATYAALAMLKLQLTKLLLSLSMNNSPQSLNADRKEFLVACQRQIRETLASAVYPYPGCTEVCGNGGCRYRHHVSPLVRDQRLYDNFVDALN
jgi:hypothetical protein